MAVVMILSVMVLVGVGNARRGEGVKADFLEFYDALQTLKLRANLGQQYGGSSMQVLTFTIGNPSSYTVNGITKTFKNGSRIMQVNTTTTSGTAVAIYFIPQGTSYEGTIPPSNGKFVTIGGIGVTSPVTTIIIRGPSGTGASYTVTITGTGYYIEKIDR